jgi:plasmid maintenance system killer protein
VILSFLDPDAAALFAGERVRRLVHVAAVAERKLQQLDSAGRRNRGLPLK